jgi:CubicO group peptidase (beta-lactamase class C family)
LIKKRRIAIKLEGLVKKAIENKVFPGCTIGISTFSKKKRETAFFSFGSIDYSAGVNDTFTFYDIASLTKPLATTLAVLILIHKNILNFHSPLEDLLETAVPRDKKKITLYSLLNHSSGLTGYWPFYKEMVSGDYEKNNSEIVKKILSSPLEYETSQKQIYSDLGFLLLGKIIEKKAGPLDEFSRKYIYKPMGMEKNIFFNTNNFPPTDSVFAPTENCAWRKKTLCGQVHDDNAYVLGGVCGHAGLFANIYGVTDLVTALVDIIKGRKEFSVINRDDLLNCVRRQSDIGSWGLGFDTPSGFSSSGRYFSKSSFGHLGFSGTSFWVDLERDISVVLLTNRIHPNRDNQRIRNFRPVFHDLVMGLLLEEIKAGDL